MLAGSTLNATEIRLDAKVFIEIQADGKHCVVRKVKILCANAIAYLRDELKLEAGTEVGVKAGQAAPFSDVKKVLDAIEKSGFRHPVAYLTAPGEAKGK
ncbi:MAG: hypothetical protein ABI645_14385 [Pseudomonadota bacterium]